jgi:hypothetical protein
MLGKWLQLFMVQRGVPHTNLHKQLTVPDGTVILFSAQWKRGKTKEIGMTRITRRDVLKLALAGGVATVLQGCGSRPSHGENPATVPRFEAALPIPPCLSRLVRTSMVTTTKSKHANRLPRFCRGNGRRSEATTASFLDRRLRPRRDERPVSDLQPSWRVPWLRTFTAVTLPPTPTGGQRM